MSRLANITPEAGMTNAGLWLDRGISIAKKTEKDASEKKKADQAKRDHVCAVANLGSTPSGYDTFFNRWNDTLIALRRSDGSGTTVPLTLKSDSRLIVGLGAESVLETSITLHRTYGVPFIPGSALKGLAARWSASLGGAWKRGESAFETLFGHAGDEEGQSGVVTFHDALAVPSQWKLQPDTITVHHPDYYAKGTAPPTDWDDPTPIPFLTCTGSFRLFLTGPLAWIERATTLLSNALRSDGIGAKTAVGYGRLSIEGYAPKAAAPQQPSAPAPETGSDFLRRVEPRIRNLAAGNAAQEIPKLLAQCPPGSHATLAQRIEKQLKRKWIVERREQAWAAELLRILDSPR